MTEVTLNGLLDSDRHLVVSVPDDVPVGPVEVIIRPLIGRANSGAALTRETAREKLRAAGLLSETASVPPDARALTPGERDLLGRKLIGQKTSDQLIDEDRGVY